jgi:hypothetical protein
MPALSAAHRFGAAVLTAAALFTLTDADPAGAWPGPLAFAFWLATVGAGLGLAVGVAAVLARRPGWTRRPRWQAVALSGGLGLLLFTPLALGLDSAFPPPPESPDGWLDALEARGLGGRLLAELLQVGPAYLLTWGLINLAAPWPLARPAALSASPVLAEAPAEGPAEAPTDVPTDMPTGALADVPSVPPAAPAERAPPAAQAKPAAAASAPAAADVLGWPRALGEEVLHVQADLHYLQVTTALGRAMVLGRLAAVEAHFGDQGLRVHRSHWVALRAVRAVRRKGEGWVVELSGGDSIPVSRRRMAQVRERLGVDFRRDG